MRNTLLYLLLIPILLLQILVYPLDVMLVWLLMWLLVSHEKHAVYGAFLGGILLDLGLYKQLGTGSIVLLSMCLLFSVYLRMHQISRKITLLPALAMIFILNQWLSYFLYYHTFSASLSIIRIALDFIILVPIFFIFVFFFPIKEREPLALRY